MTQPRILIVDDDPALLEALPEALQLRMDDVVVDTADSAGAALAKVEQGEYDVIVTDIKMPGMDGLALLAAIRARRPQTPTLMITGHGEHDLAIRALRGGAYDFILKPIDRDYFVAAVTRAVSLRQLGRLVQEQQQALERHAEELERVVDERTRELVAANRVKDEFLAVLSHELRAPLTPILGWAQILRAGGDAARVRRGADVIERNVRLEMMLVDDLIDLTRITQGKIALDLAPQDLRDVIREARDSVAEVAWRKGLTVQCDTPSEPLHVNGDRGRLQQIIANLLWNAVKFTPRGGRVNVALERDGESGVVRVRDTGPGIAAEFLPFVFDMFRQQEEGMRRQSDGLGIGLAVARHLAELHDGSIDVACEGPGQGAEFTVRLPLLPAAALETPTSMTETAEPSTVLNGATVLVVDDSVDTNDATRTMLEILGARVITAGDGLEALDCIAREQPDVVLCDLRLPVMDGFEFIHRLREDPRHVNLPVIAVSALRTPADYRHTREAGFDAHIGKPFDYSVLCKAVETVMRSRKRLKAS